MFKIPHGIRLWARLPGGLKDSPPECASAFSEIVDDLRIRHAPAGGSLYQTRWPGAAMFSRSLIW